LVWLEGVVLPTGLRVLPQGFFGECWRLTSIDARRTALEAIGMFACSGCRSLTAFEFPPTFLCMEYAAFDSTSITSIDLTETAAERVVVCDMVILVDLVLPRRCVLDHVQGLPSLRRVTFGASDKVKKFAWHATDVRFDGLNADADFSPGLLAARVYGEVACEMGCETLPFPPP
jgi:hypothetical protein